MVIRPGGVEFYLDGNPYALRVAVSNQECIAIRKVTLDGIVNKLGQREPRLVVQVPQDRQYTHAGPNIDCSHRQLAASPLMNAGA